MREKTTTQLTYLVLKLCLRSCDAGSIANDHIGRLRPSYAQSSATDDSVFVGYEDDDLIGETKLFN